MPRSRRATLLALVAAHAPGAVDLSAGADPERTRSAPAALPGVGPWTVEMIAMRALGDSDAFVATDLGIRLAARALDMPTTPAALLRRSRAWQPWRAYAVPYLRAADDHRINHTPDTTPTPARETG